MSQCGRVIPLGGMCSGTVFVIFYIFAGLFKIILAGGNILRYGNRIYSIPPKKLGNKKKGNKNTRNILRNILLCKF